MRWWFALMVINPYFRQYNATIRIANLSTIIVTPFRLLAD